MDINFELYKIFYYVAQSQSFSEAAKKLYITQSAVSQSIKNLEDKLGQNLFLRKSRNIKLTKEGEVLLKHIEQAFNIIKAGEYKILEMQDLNSGEVRIGVSDTVCRYYLIPYIRKFYQLYPGIKIQVINRTSSQILEILKENLVDVGIVTLPVNDKKVNLQSFMNVNDVFVASGRFSHLLEEKTSMKQLLNYPLLMLPPNSTTRRNLDAYLETMGLAIKAEIELESMELLVEFARIGLGIAYVLRESAAAAIKSGELFEVPVSDGLPARELGIVSLKDVSLSKAAEEFVRISCIKL